ncbi:MAG: aldolase/citrate lyase family protein [Vicinamibacterales bacterium]
MMGLALLAGMVMVQGAQKQRLNPVIGLLEQGKPVFGLYVPSNRRFRGPGQPPEVTQKSPADLASEALGYKHADFIFDGAMEGGVDRAMPTFEPFVKALAAAGPFQKSPFVHLTHPLIIKTPEFGEGPAAFARDVQRELNLGVSGVMFPGAETAEQVRAGIAAMRFKSHGGTRPDDVGMAPAYWGLSEAEYKNKADLWPLNPDGELINWTIVESKEGLAHVREIAAVPGIGVLWPGAGTLRGVFTTTNAAGERHFDEQGWENAIQTVLSACKEFKIACGFPANEKDIEMRMKQGFSVFVMGWGDSGFKTVEMGKKLAGR